MSALTTIELLYDAGLLWKKWEKDGRLYVESCGDDENGWAFITFDKAGNIINIEK
jgi:hypothetical protein